MNHNTETHSAIPHSQMDRQITPKKSVGQWLLYAALILTIIAGGFIWFLQEPKRVLSVPQKQVKISTVSEGIFEDFIPLRIRVIPLKTVLLDAVEGGRVEKKWVEDGATVEAGQVLFELSNTDLQLSVMRNESDVIQQLNNIRTIELQLEQNRLAHERSLVDIEYDIIRLERLAKRYQTLVKKGGVSQKTLDETVDELEYAKKRQSITIASRDSDQKLQQQQFKFLQHNGQRLEANLEFARTNLEKLKVTATVAGKLSGFDIEVGQSIQRGARIGQIDSPNQFKYSADIDEFYLNRTSVNQQASLTLNQTEYTLSISKIYSQVENGQFRVDMLHNGLQPADIKSGQTLQTKLILGDSRPARLIPNGAFFQETGGHWIFVFDSETKQATKRNIRLGRRNSRVIEVLEGLDRDEQVITSSYINYSDIDSLNIES